jgi:hypothetical protein
MKTGREAAAPEPFGLPLKTNLPRLPYDLTF